MNKIVDRKDVTKLSVLLSATYMISYMTRINFGAIISEMENATQFSRTLLSMSVTGCFAFYGTGQIVSGICGDRFSPKKLVALGLMVSSAMNILVTLCKSPYQMLIVWSINGFAQAFMWPPLVRIMSSLLSKEDYTKVSVSVIRASSFGTIAVYLLSPVVISFFGWKQVFVFCATAGFIMLVLWCSSSLRCDTVYKKKSVADSRADNKVLFRPFMVCIMLAIILQGMLRDGVTTWMPSYINETYNISSKICILSGVILPVFSIICIQATSILYKNKFTNPIKCASVLFGAGAVSAVMLFITTGNIAPLSILFLAILTGSMHGVNMMLITMLPPYFEKHGNVSTVSGVLNSCTYVGSAISTYGIALLSEKLGWNFTLLSWIGIALSGTMICILATKPWNRFINND
ncbi:MAG: MFS transporter [Anaerofustis stercorihominis]|nr:MFS transporter [Anaerofustis stercorihominis]